MTSTPFLALDFQDYQTIANYVEGHAVKDSTSPAYVLYMQGERVRINLIEGEWGRDLKGCWIEMKNLRMV
jgi:hypothetical protein